MPESGGLPRQSHSHAASATTGLSGARRVQREQATSHRQLPTAQAWLGETQRSSVGDAVQMDGNASRRSGAKRRVTFWQIVFGQGARRTKVGDRRSHPISKQSSSKLAPEQVRQAVLNRSRQLATSSSANAQRSTSASRHDARLPARHVSLKQADSSHQADPRAISAFQPSHRGLSYQAKLSRQVGMREQERSLAQRREARGRTRRNGARDKHGLRFAEPSQIRALHAQSGNQLHQRASVRPRSRSLSAGLYAARMLILSVGIGVLVGTMLSMWDPASRFAAGASQQTAKKSDAIEPASTGQVTATPVFQLPKMGQELSSLKAAVQALALQTPQLTPGIFLFDLDTEAYLDLNGGASFAAASTIKVPILVAFFQDVDAGKIRLDELLTMRKELVASGSGEMQGLPVGTQFTTLETINKMITISDNTATNMVIARLGGMAALNQRFRSWGLVSTAINNVLPDLEGTNTTSPKDMALLMTRISQGELVSMRSRDRMLDIMQRTVNRSQLPQGLGKGATIAHKTGDIGGLIGDVGLIDMPSGKRYALTVLVKRSFNDDRAYDLVQKISRTVYQYLSRVPATQSSPVTPNPSIAPSEQALPRADNDIPANPASIPSKPTDIAITQSSPFVDTAR